MPLKKTLPHAVIFAALCWLSSCVEMVSSLVRIDLGPTPVAEKLQNKYTRHKTDYDSLCGISFRITDSIDLGPQGYIDIYQSSTRPHIVAGKDLTVAKFMEGGYFKAKADSIEW